MSESQNKRWRRSHSVLSIPSELSAPLRSATRARIINTGNTNNRVNMSFSFFLCAYSVLRLSLHTLPPGSAEEGCSFLVDDRRIPEREREKNSSDLSRSYHAAITDVKKRETPGLGTEARREAGMPHDILNCTIDVMRTRVVYSSSYAFSKARVTQDTHFLDFFHVLCYAKNGS